MKLPKQAKHLPWIMEVLEHVRHVNIVGRPWRKRQSPGEIKRELRWEKIDIHPARDRFPSGSKIKLKALFQVDVQVFDLFFDVHLTQLPEFARQVVSMTQQGGKPKRKTPSGLVAQLLCGEGTKSLDLARQSVDRLGQGLEKNQSQSMLIQSSILIFLL